MYKTKFRQRLCLNSKILPRILRTKTRREGPSRCGHFLPEHAIPTSFSPDFSGQKWTSPKIIRGGKTGGPLNFRKNRVRREQRLQRALRIQRDRNRWAWNRRVEILRYLCQGIRRQITDIREHIRNCREAMFFHSVQNWQPEITPGRISKISVRILNDLTTGTKPARFHTRPSGMNTDPEVTFLRMIDRAVMIQPLDPHILGLAQATIFPVHQVLFEKINAVAELSCVLYALDRRHHQRLGGIR